MPRSRNWSVSISARRILTGIALFTVFVGSPGQAQRGQALMLDRLEAGDWEVRDRDPAGGRTRLCIDSGRKLVQIRHQKEACRSFTVEDTAENVTIHYTCAGNGYGRTRIHFENTGLVQLETQGIAGGLPFAFTAEARRMGTCRR